MSEKAIIIGAGGGGKELLEELEKENVYDLLGFIDDDEEKQGKNVEGKPIIGKIAEINNIIHKKEPDIIFIAIPSSNGKLIRKIYQQCQGERIKIKVVPRISEIINGTITIDQVRDIEVEDLLGRAMIRQDFSIGKEKIKDKTIMVCGAAGSIGSELCKQLIKLNIKKLVCYDSWENGMFFLEKTLNKVREAYDEDYGKPTEVEVRYIIGNILDKKKLDYTLSNHKPDYIFNAAAYKHVPLMEINPDQAIINNIQGTINLFEASTKHEVENFILISSDKAVNPTNIMGTTKRVTEKLMHYYAQKSQRTTFNAVRFGNVLNSNGSVIPVFKEQIKEGHVTVTHKDMVRYFMSIPEAAQLVIQSCLMGKNDEIFVLDMGEPVKILDLANLMIRLSGQEPKKDVKISFIGLRPGEKIYEEPLTEIEETDATKNDKIFILNKDEKFNHKEFIGKVQELITYVQSSTWTKEHIKEMLRELVPTYTPNKHENGNR